MITDHPLESRPTYILYSTEKHPIINRSAIARRSVNDVLSEYRRPDIGRHSVYPTVNRSYALLRYIVYLTNEWLFFWVHGE